jgi:hypothetical protein
VFMWGVLVHKNFTLLRGQGGYRAYEGFGDTEIRVSRDPGKRGAPACPRLRVHLGPVFAGFELTRDWVCRPV